MCEISIWARADATKPILLLFIIKNGISGYPLSYKDSPSSLSHSLVIDTAYFVMSIEEICAV